jgi:DNA-binding transcriptional MerR regulator
LLSIGRLAKAANVSPRAVRHYESLGLISAACRGENNYRYFSDAAIERVGRILDLQNLGFSLHEIRDVLMLDPSSIESNLREKLSTVDQEISQLSQRKDRIVNLLSISEKIQSSRMIGIHERRVYMDAVKEEVIKGLKARQGSVRDIHLEYLKRDQSLYDTPEKRKFIEAVKNCILFAKTHNLTLGPGRGSCPASVVLYGLGFSGIDPTRYDLIPERLSTIPPDIHIDVEFENGQPFVDYCQKVSDGLSWGKITAFKMPLIDIINNVQVKVANPINFQDIPDDDPVVLQNIQNGDIDKIFLLDYSPEALVMKYENHFPEYVGNTKIKEYLLSQPIESFRDVINIIAIWRPNDEEKIARIDRYKQAKKSPVRLDFLTPDLISTLEPNYGLVIYHEDIMRIIAAYTDWNWERCSQLRRNIRFNIAHEDLSLFKEMAPKTVFDFVVEETPWMFCKPHAISFAQFTKQTSILKSLHKKIYFDEISKWQDRNGFVWDDIGIKIKGVSLLQH